MSPDHAVVRLAVADDADRIGLVHVRSWQAAYAGIIGADVLDDLSTERRSGYWREAIGRGERVWVVEREGTVVGFAAVGPARDDDLPAGAGEVPAIYLEPESWSMGLGRALFAAAVDDLRAGGFEPLVLWVLTDNDRGRRFYEAAGWTPDGTERPIEIGGRSLGEIRYRAP
jgi:GNAT superfamily N-acetyltransferase